VTRASSGEAFEAAAWSWVEHLRSGGTTTWREWRGQRHPAAASPAAPLPSAAQLEVVRRLAEQAVGEETITRLADLVTSTPVGGRGLVDVPLPWPTAPSTGAAPATEPEDLPARELLRVCVTVIARLSRSAGSPAVVAQRRRRRRPWQRGFVVAGTSPHAGAVRDALLDAGRVEGGHRPTVLVVGAPLETMMAMHWRRRVEQGSGTRWRRVWSRTVAAGALPEHVDLADTAAAWADRVGAGNVHVVLERDAADAVAVAGRLLDVRLDPAPGPGADVVDTDLLRRLNQVLAIRGAGTLAGSTAECLRAPWARPLGVPRAQLGWAVEQAEVMATRLAAGGFALHGDPRLVVPSSDASLPRSVDPDETLARALVVVSGLGTSE
jgi:hypothetical protein